MTQMLASVTDPGEAEIALVEGADIIDLKDPAKGAFGAVDLSVVKSTVARVAGRRKVSAVCGDLPMDPQKLVEAATNLIDAGVDFIKIGILPSADTGDCIAALREVATRGKLIAVCFADLGVDFEWLPLLEKAGFAGAMIDTASKDKSRLINHMSISELDRFIRACRRNKLMTGLAGSLEAPDVARLLLLEPDFLGFRGALCGGSRSDRIVPDNVRLIRDLIPRIDTAHDHGDEIKVDWRFLAARGYSVDNDAKPETDRVFVHDFVLPVSIGAYDFERNITQKVRFNIDADVRRIARQAEDMRDVFSYDLIVDAIRLILSRGHVALVETLAEQIADTLLTHPRLVGISVRVEKLDVVEGYVGVELKRERAAPSLAAQHRATTRGDIGTVKTGA